jgi:hypothetical protein
MLAFAVLAAPILLCAASLRWGRRLASRRKRPPTALRNLSDETMIDRRTGAVRSVQAADLLLPDAALGEIWSPAHLERLARTYWRFLARITLGVVRVHYTEHSRSVVLLLPAFKLITFAKPEYEMDSERGLVQWRIERGLLVARSRRAAASNPTEQLASRRTQFPRAAGEQGHLQIEIRRLVNEPPLSTGVYGRQALLSASDRGNPPAVACLHIEVEVANFYPAIAFALSRRLYDITQSRIHVLVTRAFLRSLARGSSQQGVPALAKSKAGRLSEAFDGRASRGDSEPPAAQAS